MAHFISYVTGRSKTTASRLGTKSTGVTAQAQGWDIGGYVRCLHIEGRDMVEFVLTGGSNAIDNAKVIARFVLDGSEVKREV